MNLKNRQFYLLLFILALVVNFCTINYLFFTDDPGLYASIAKQLIYKHNFFQLYSYGADWLDKPHLPFWLVMISFRTFGIYTWTYKLPAIICFLLSLLYTWLFARKYYGAEVAAMAVLIVSTSLHVMMSNTDIRAEPYLMAFITGAIYHISNLEKRSSGTQLVLAALLTALAVMTKGVFVLIAVYGALGGHLLLTGKLREIFRFKWVLLVLLTVILTTPELYSLYIQFDLHPEKVVFGHQHVSGIKWFLWDSQFGRFTNSGPINRKEGSIFYFLHTLLWAFAPWCLLFYFSVYKIVSDIIKRKRQHEYYAISGGLILLILFSLSGFQLPFYTNIIFPLFAICTARVCHEQLASHTERIIRSVTQWIYVVALPIVVILLNYFLKPANYWPFIIDLVVFGLIVMYLLNAGKQIPSRLFMLNCAAMLFACFYVNTEFYPVIINHKGEPKAAAYINQHVPQTTAVYSVKSLNNVFQFYCDRPVGLFNMEQFNATPSPAGALFYADQETVDQMHTLHQQFVVVQEFSNYPEENILPAFINKNTRASTLSKVYLIKKP